MEDRRELAVKLGAETAFWAADDSVADQVREWNGGYGVPLVFDATGAAAILGRSIALAGKGGTVLVLGLTSAPGTILPGALPIDELRVQGSSCQLREDFEAAVALIEERAADVPLLLTHRFPLEATAEAFELASGGTPGVVKVLIEL